MSAISNFLSFLRSAIYAIDVRDGIADAIEQCYNDVNNPTLKTEALEAALQTKIDEGEMAALTIGDGTITGAKLANGTIPKAKLDPSITFDADDELDNTSTNAIQNKVVAAEFSAINESLSKYNVLNPDDYTGGDSNRIQRCINKLADEGVGGVILIARKFVINSNIVCTLSTNNNLDVTKNHVFITFLGIGENAGFEFGASSVSFKGNDNGSPYGGFRFKNINFTRPAAGIGYGSAFTQMSGMIRCVFDNCRFSGFKKVFDCTDNGIAKLKLVQNLTCINCYFTDCSDYVIDGYSVGNAGRSAYLYAVNILSCICENCKGLIKGSAVSGYSVWTNVNIRDCTIESCTGIPIVFGVGTRGVNIEGCYFEKNDYNDTHTHIDMLNLFGTNHNAPANVYGISIRNNAFIKGISTGDYEAHSVAIRLPEFEPWSASDDSTLMHGIIENNVCEDIFVSYTSLAPDGNRRRWLNVGNISNISYDHNVFYSA